jgi:hypothetical protein
VLYPLPRLSDQGRDGWIDDNIAALENELQLALEEQEKSFPAGSPSSPHHRRSAELLHPPNDEEHDQSGTGYSRLEGLERDSLLYIQNQEAAMEEEEEDSNDDNTEREQYGGERWYEDETEKISSGIQHSRDYNHSHDTSDEDDEGPQLAKRRRLLQTPANEALTSRNQSLRPRLTGRHSVSPALVRRLKIDAQSQTARLRLTCCDGEFL